VVERHDPQVLFGAESVTQALRQLEAYGHDALPVLSADGEQVQGWVTGGSVMRAIVRQLGAARTGTEPDQEDDMRQAPTPLAGYQVVALEVAAGFGSLLALPLRTDQRPAGAVALHGETAGVFRGAAHDVALLFAAQGGTAVRNASLYGACRRMADDLHAALESRAVIEQAKGMLRAERGVSTTEAFRLLSRYSQDTNQRVRMVSAQLVQRRLPAAALGQPGDRHPGARPTARGSRS
jgi:hypothetical protein